MEELIYKVRHSLQNPLGRVTFAKSLLFKGSVTRDEKSRSKLNSTSTGAHRLTPRKNSEEPQAAMCSEADESHLFKFISRTIQGLFQSVYPRRIIPFSGSPHMLLNMFAGHLKRRVHNKAKKKPLGSHMLQKICINQSHLFEFMCRRPGIAVKFLSVHSRQILFTYAIASRSILMSICVRQRITNSAQQKKKKRSAMDCGVGREKNAPHRRTPRRAA